MRISAKKRYADLTVLCEFARLLFVQTDIVVKRRGAMVPAYGRAGRLFEEGDTLVKIKTGRKLWRWPDPVNEAERKAALKEFAERLRHRFPPARSSNAVALITLTTGVFNFPTVEHAFTAAGWVGIVLGSLAKLNRDTTRPDFHGGNLPLLWHIFDLQRVSRLNRIVQADGDEWSVLGAYSGRRLIRINQGEIIHGRQQWILAPAADFFHDLFLPALYGCDMARIRECPICARPFIALRVDAGACSHCLNAHRQRESRRRWKEKGKIYDQNRNQNRLATTAVRRRLIKQ